MAIAHHAMLRLQDGSPLARTAAQRRCLARAVFAKIGSPLLAFGLADTHLHLLLACLRALAGQLVKHLELSLRQRLALAAPFAGAYLKPVDDIWHLDRAFRYVLRQPDRHALEIDPLREGSNLPDLLGLRAIGGYTAGNVREWLPRIHRRDLLELLGVKEIAPQAGPLEWVVEACLVAAGLPALTGSSSEVLCARRAALEVIGTRLSRAELASTLGVSERMISRLRQQSADPQLVEAIRRQLHLMALVPRSPAGLAGPDLRAA